MKFDYIIGNPPYQEEVENNGRSNPIYWQFMDQSYKISDIVELITPARFLFNAGQTPKAWNEKMLNNEHFKVINYESNSLNIFKDADIRGGVAVTIHNVKKKFKKIQIFNEHNELRTVLEKLSNKAIQQSLDSIVSSRGLYRFSDSAFKDYPYISERLGSGTGNMMASNVFEKMPEIFTITNEENDRDNKKIKLLGLYNKERIFQYINLKYIITNKYINGYNIAFPKSNGSGKFGEVLTLPEILSPLEGATDTFISIGSFNSLFEAESLYKYIKTKFLRALLGIKKTTQDNPKAVWSLIPLQDFTSSSDIDWTQSIHEIDLQLYKKYGLDEKEIEFIETHVKEMT